jgi:hypothetical protein
MGWMNSMMEDMIKGLPVEEREALLLKMMPEMMKQADMTQLAPNMLKEAAGVVNLLLLYDIIRSGLEDEDLRLSAKEVLVRLHESMPAMMEMMQPMMTSMMSAVMPKMMGFMAVMMPMPVSVYEKNDGSVGISSMNLAMMSGMYTGVVKEVLEKGAEDFEKSLEGII